MEISATMAGSNKFDKFLRAIALASGCCALVWAAGCDSKTSAGGPASGGMQALPVQVEVVQAVRIPETTEYLSTLKSRQAAQINPQVEGQITAIFVKSGDSVSKGTSE